MRKKIRKPAKEELKRLKQMIVRTGVKAGAQVNGRKTVRGHDILMPS